VSPLPAAPDRSALAEALDRRAAKRAGGAERAHAPALDSGASDVSLSASELATAAGLTERDVEALASFGLISGRAAGREVVYDGEALVVARIVAGFLAQGLEVRHLRMYKLSVDREVGVYEQLVTPLLRQRIPESRERAATRLEELAGLGGDLREALLRQAVRPISGA
jgi:hypothetical protein